MADILPPTLNGDFETDFEIDEAASAPQLGIQANGKINRRLVSQERVGETSFSAALHRVQYGTYKEAPACLVVLDFTFRFKPKVASRYSYASVLVSFTRAVDIRNHKILAADPSEDPKVVNMAPKTVYGIVKTVDEKTVKDITVPVMFESPIGLFAGVELHARMEQTKQQENRMEIHGQLYEDDDHVDEANAVSWDLFENPAQKDGILRNFRTAIVVQNPPGQAMWMKVIVKPSVKFSVDVRRLFGKNDPFARLLQQNDDPVPLDGITAKAGQLDLGCDDFTSPEFPWSKVLRMPIEYQVFVLP